MNDWILPFLAPDLGNSIVCVCVCVCMCVCVYVCVLVISRVILEKGEVNVSIQSYYLYSEANRPVLKILMLWTRCLKLGYLL